MTWIPGTWYGNIGSEPQRPTTVDCMGLRDCPDCDGQGVRLDLPDYVLDLMAPDDPQLNCKRCNGQGAFRCNELATVGEECETCHTVNRSPL